MSTPNKWLGTLILGKYSLRWKMGEIPYEDLSMQFEIFEPDSFDAETGDLVIHATGSVMWDGYSDWHTDCLHLCSLRDAIAFGKALEEAYEKASKHLPRFEGIK